MSSKSSARRPIQVFNMSFLDMITNFTGAVIILFLLAAQNVEKRAFPNIPTIAGAHFDPEKRILWDTLEVDPAHEYKEGDTLFVIIGKPKKAETGGQKMQPVAVAEPKKESWFERLMPGKKQVDENAVVLENDQYATTIQNAVSPEPPKPAEKCAISAAFVENVKCNDADTPGEITDDTYTFEVKTVKNGPCLGGWKDNFGKSAAYAASIAYGPFLIKDGRKEITVADASDPSLTKKVTAFAPAYCSTIPVNRNPVDAQVGLNPPGYVCFYIGWEDAGDNVDLIVEKGNKRVSGSAQKNPQIGQWSSNRPAGWLAPRTSQELVSQMEKPIPGVYRVYAKFKKSSKNAPKTTVKVRLLALSKKYPKSSQQFDIDVPLEADGGGLFQKPSSGKLLGEFEVMADGSIYIGKK